MQTPFPEFFHDFYSHMIMIEVTPDIISLMPPNQCDWFFTLTKINDNNWSVIGAKDDILGYNGPEEQKYNYIWNGTKWIYTK